VRESEAAKKKKENRANSSKNKNGDKTDETADYIPDVFPGELESWLAFVGEAVVGSGQVQPAGLGNTSTNRSCEVCNVPIATSASPRDESDTSDVDASVDTLSIESQTGTEVMEGEFKVN
jgi:hypothetical protein